MNTDSTSNQCHCQELAKLQEDAFLKTGKPEDSREMWRQYMIIQSPAFQFWDTGDEDLRADGPDGGRQLQFHEICQAVDGQRGLHRRTVW